MEKYSPLVWVKLVGWGPGGPEADERYAFHTYRYPTSGWEGGAMSKSKVVLGDANGRSVLGSFVEVSVPGFFLIAEVHKSSNVPLYAMGVRLHGVEGRQWVYELASLAKGMPVQIGQLSLHTGISVETPAAGQALVGLLQQSQHWIVDHLYLSGTVDGRFWQDLASALPGVPVEHVTVFATNAKICGLTVTSKVLARGGSDQVKKVWMYTGGIGSYWWVRGRFASTKIFRRLPLRRFWGNGMDRMEAGWKDIAAEIFKEVFLIWI